jgi:hypothetical protein
VIAIKAIMMQERSNAKHATTSAGPVWIPLQNVLLATHLSFALQTTRTIVNARLATLMWVKDCAINAHFPATHVPSFLPCVLAATLTHHRKESIGLLNQIVAVVLMDTSTMDIKRIVRLVLRNVKPALGLLITVSHVACMEHFEIIPLLVLAKKVSSMLG